MEPISRRRAAHRGVLRAARHLAGYNDGVPGPTLRLRPGDRERWRELTLAMGMGMGMDVGMMGVVEATGG